MRDEQQNCAEQVAKQRRLEQELAQVREEKLETKKALGEEMRKVADLNEQYKANTQKVEMWRTRCLVVEPELASVTRANLIGETPTAVLLGQNSTVWSWKCTFSHPRERTALSRPNPV